MFCKRTLLTILMVTGSAWVVGCASGRDATEQISPEVPCEQTILGCGSPESQVDEPGQEDPLPNLNDEPDGDGDGVGDLADDFPEDPTESRDSDGDGVGDNTDQFPDDITESRDSDGDGVGDNSDAFPENPLEWLDSDGDGVGDNSDTTPNDPGAPPDGDGDGTTDEYDAFPDDPTEQVEDDTESEEEADDESTDGDGEDDNDPFGPDILDRIRMTITVLHPTDFQLIDTSCQFINPCPEPEFTDLIKTDFTDRLILFANPKEDLIRPELLNGPTLQINRFPTLTVNPVDRLTVYPIAGFQARPDTLPTSRFTDFRSTPSGVQTSQVINFRSTPAVLPTLESAPAPSMSLPSTVSWSAGLETAPVLTRTSTPAPVTALPSRTSLNVTEVTTMRAAPAAAQPRFQGTSQQFRANRFADVPEAIDMQEFQQFN